MGLPPAWSARSAVWEELDGTAVSALGVRSWKLSNVDRSSGGRPKIYSRELLRALEGTLSRWSRLRLQSIAPTNPHWACVLGYGPFFLCVIDKKDLYTSSGDNNRLMMMRSAVFLSGKSLWLNVEVSVEYLRCFCFGSKA
jgi:hypothetical protein